MAESTTSSYDEVPYPSHAYKNTRPDSLATVARIFGMKPPDVRKSSVLEIGCASGGNLIPMAAAYPDSRFVGIDMSEKQIEVGRKAVSELGLTNIELRRLSVMDVDKSLGTFDYIIAHGIYSWVPEDVREKILEVCSKNLSKNGLAYVSFNTLPGWNMIKTIRDMMVYHTERFSKPASKILQARMMLNFAIENTVGDDSIHKRLLKTEAELLGKLSDNYLYHDHLEHYNEPCYLHEFMEKASRVGLKYLGDSRLAGMHLGNHPKGAREILGKINDIVRREQYLDFLTNRRFRSTILCHAGVQLSRTIRRDRLEGLYYTSRLVPKEPLDKIDLSAGKSTKFVNPSNNSTINVKNPISAAWLCVLAENSPHPLSVDDLVRKACERLNKISDDTVRRSFMNNAGNMILNGTFEVVSDPGFHTKQVHARPKVWPCAQYMARIKSNVPNVLHANVGFGEHLKVLVQYLDGKRTIDEIFEEFIKDFLKGDLRYRQDEKTVTDEAELRPILKDHLRNRLQFLANNAFLVE